MRVLLSTYGSRGDTGVDVELSDGQSLRADYLVGCHGGRSLVRKAASIEVPGVRSDDQPPGRPGRDGHGAGMGLRHDAHWGMRVR